MPNTMTLISSQTVSTAANAVTFSSIPQTYTDLRIIVSGRLTVSPASDLILKFNGSSTNYAQKYVIGTGSSVVSGSQSYAQIGVLPGTSHTANAFGCNTTYLPNYTSSNYKAFISADAYENNATAAYLSTWANIWSNTAAITSIEVSTAPSYTMAVGTTIYIYGIKNS